MFEVLMDYSFWTVLLGTLFLAIAASLIGTVTVLTRQSLIGDMLGHAAYPGVVFAFILFQTRHPLVLMLGAMVSGYLSYVLVYWMAKHRRQSLINSQALVSASFFGLGMVLKQLVQGHPAFSGSSKAGLQTYLFGQAAFIKASDVALIMVVSSACLLLYTFYYPQLKVYLFDPVFAQLSGVSVRGLEQLTRLMMIALISVGLKVVGAMLMSAFLVAPAALGILWGKSYASALKWSLGLAVLSTGLGTYMSSVGQGLSTGPSIIVMMAALALVKTFWDKIIRRVVHA